MIPGEIITQTGAIQLNTGRSPLNILVENQGDRPIQVGSHFHFLEVNSALAFFHIDQETKNITPIDRSDANNPTRGMRLNIPAGTAIRFEPGDEKQVELIPFGGLREIYGFNGLVNGQL